jgi:hypothetical protein
MSDRVTLRSYRRVFKIEHRVYRVDRWVLPMPGGVPLLGIAYFVGIFLTVLILSALPGTNLIANAVSMPIRYVVVPLVLAALAMQVAPDGRATPLFAWSWITLRYRQQAAVRDGRATRWATRLPVAWDLTSPVTRRCRVTGPAVVRFHEPVDVHCDHRTNLIARRRRGRAQTVTVQQARKLRVR